MKILKSATVFVVVCTIAILAYWGYYTSQDKKAVQNPETCKGCHEMQPAYYTWKATAHAVVNCADCHKNIDLYMMRYRHDAGFAQPVKVKKMMTNDICNSCHSTNRLITPPGDVIIPHDFHMKKGIDCMDCHDNVAHANSVKNMIEPKVVEPKDFGAEEAARLVAKGNRIPMAKCMVCHNGVMATKECAPCHSVLRLPETHNAADFTYNHGGLVFSNVGSCYKCHNEELVAPKGFSVNNNSRATITTYTRNNMFCQNCHSERPKTHTAMYSVDHAQDAKVSKIGCYICHDIKQPQEFGKIGQPSTDVYCAKCHYTKHPYNWEATHKTSVTPTSKAKCLICHDEATSCITCHQQKKAKK